MKEFSVGMALFDFIPVICFLVAAVLLQRYFYSKMEKGLFAVFACGTIDITVAGTLKALYKLLYAVGICDFTALSDLFMPTQSIGFLFAGIALVGYVIAERKKRDRVYSAPPAVFNGTMLFVGLMILGLFGMTGSLSILAFKKKKTFAAVMFIVTFVGCLAMGYLSSRNFTEAAMNWIAEGVNAVAQGALLLGSLSLTQNAEA